MNITIRDIPGSIPLAVLLGELREKYGCTFRCVDGQVVGDFAGARAARQSNVIPPHPGERPNTAQ